MISLSLGLDRRLIAVNINLPASKSESNRALIIQAISSNDVVLENISSARDTQTMLRLLSSSDKTLDVLDAGTTMRFLTAYMSAVGKEKILTGTPRMQKRPIGELVNALNILGANITYDRILWGKPSSNAIVIARIPGTDRAPIFAYEAGSPMVEGVAPARRLAFFLGGDSPKSLTSEGLFLFDVAVCWVTQTGGCGNTESEPDRSIFLLLF